MDFSPEQDAALAKANAWFEAWQRGQDVPQVFYLAGCAGTGKTTLAKYLAAEWGRVLFAAYTGKAAHVLRQKGCGDARTIHSLIYIRGNEAAAQVTTLKEALTLAEEAAYLDEQEDRRDHPDTFARGETPWSATTRLSQAKVAQIKAQIVQAQQLAAHAKGPQFTLNPISTLASADALILDEVSMVDDTMYRDLVSFGVPILALGDPAQLPPVRGTGAFTNREPDFLLQEVHRQAQGSPILWAATLARQGKRVPSGRHGDDLLVIDLRDAGRHDMKALVMGADQMLCGRNLTRRNANKRWRTLRGYGLETPCLTDKLVCLQNHNEVGLLNGSLWEVLDAEHMRDDHSVSLTVRPMDGGMSVSELTVLAHDDYFLDGEPEWFAKSEKECFDYGYAMTVHKSQGSQWDNVFLQDESSAFRADAHKWLYTGMTRAAKKLVIVR